MARCCPCNGINTVCKRCSCVRAGRLCVSCHPLNVMKCCNQGSSSSFHPWLTSTSVDMSISSVRHFENIQSSPHNSSNNNNSFDSFCDSPGPSVLGDQFSDDNPSVPNDSNKERRLTCGEVDNLMSTAYGEPIHHCPVSIVSHWLVYWNKIIQHSGRHYDLPKGSIGRKYVSRMIDEICHFNSGNFPSERLLVFSSVILQRDKMSTKGPEIRKVIDRRLSLWKEEKYDLLVQEATRCDKAI